MNLELSDTHHAFGETLRRLLSVEAHHVRQREWWATDSGRDPSLWAKLSDVGVPALLVPEEFDGIGADELDAFVLLEEAGRSAVPDALLESCVVVPAVLSRMGPDGLRRRWLRRLASGQARGTVGRLGAPVPDAHVSDLILLADGAGVVAYERADVELEPVGSMDPARRLARVRPCAGTGTPLSSSASAHLDALLDAGSAALLNGLTQALLDRTVEYAKIRHQFGRAVGSFQSVKHQLAHATSLNTVSRQATLAAMYALAREAGDPLDVASLARLCAVDAAREGNRVSLQVHGGIGFTWEHELHLWLKRGKCLEWGYSSYRDSAAAAGTAALTSRVPAELS